MTGSATVECAGERVVLLPQRALFRPAASTLYIADTHFGKDSAFRAASIPIPVGTTDADLERLDGALDTTRAGRLVVLGDFYHAAQGRSEPLARRLDAWRRSWEGLRLLVVRGNHDRHAGDVPPSWGADVVDGPLRDGPFVLRHEPEADPDGYVLSGHVHPGARLTDPGGSGVVLPCFRFGRGCAVLPAFGSFTGLRTVKPRPADTVFVIADGTVRRVGGRVV